MTENPRFDVALIDEPYTLDPTRTPSDDTGMLLDLLGELASRLADAKGTDWKNNSTATLAGLRAHLDAVGSNAHGESPQSIGAVDKDGDTGIGPLALLADGANPLSVPTRQQTVQRAGDTLSGRLRAGYTGFDTPQNDDELVTRIYVDLIAQGLRPKIDVRQATAAPLPAYTRSGNTLTAAGNGVLLTDTLSAIAGRRILVKNETGANEPFNGIYVVTQAGSGAAPWILTRATDADTSADLQPGSFVHVNEGTADMADTGWALVTDGPITLGTTPLAFGQIYGPGSVVAGAGLTRAGNTLFVSNGAITKAMLGALSLITSDFAAGYLPTLVADDLVARDALAPAQLRVGQLVYTKSDGKLWKTTTVGDPPGTPHSFADAGSSASPASRTSLGTLRSNSDPFVPTNPSVYLVDDPAFVHHIHGLDSSGFNSANAVISTGSAFIPALRRVVDLSASVSDVASGLTASTLYHFYLYEDANGVAQIERSIEAPVGLGTSGFTNPNSYPMRGSVMVKGPAATPDFTRRYVCSRFAQNATAWYGQRTSMGGQVLYTTNFTLSSFVGTTLVLVGAGGFVPPGVQMITVGAWTNSTVQQDILFANVDGTTFAAFNSVSRSDNQITIPVSDLQQFQARLSVAGWTCTLTVHGYHRRR